MGLLTLPFQLPFMPLQAVIKLGQVIQEQAEQELYNPASVRRQLEDVEEARVHGEVSDEDVAKVEGEAVGRLVGSGTRRPAGSAEEGS